MAPRSYVGAKGRVNTSARQTFAVLRLVARGGEPLGVSEVARRLGLPPSTAHRILVTLEESGYLQRDLRDSRVSLGIAAHELRHALFGRFPMRGVAMPFLDRLAAASQETAALQVNVGRYAVRIAGVEGPQPIHRTLHLGEIFPLHVTSGGRAMLAFMAEPDVEAFIGRGLTAEVTVPGLESAACVRRHLSHIRARGYELDLGNLYPEARSIAFPVRPGDGVAVASVSVIGAASQFDPEADPAGRDGWTTIISELAARLAEDRAMVEHPFGHLDAAGIQLDIALPSSAWKPSDHG